jgi:hypothetical protein
VRYPVIEEHGGVQEAWCLFRGYGGIGRVVDVEEEADAFGK